MILQRLSILNYKNIAEATLELSPKLNCFLGRNGAGKTNVLDAVYFLSFCRSMFTSVDSQVMRHDADFFVLEGEYGETPCSPPAGDVVEPSTGGGGSRSTVA